MRSDIAAATRSDAQQNSRGPCGRTAYGRSRHGRRWLGRGGIYREPVDGAIYFHTVAEEQKFANLHTNPHVVLITGCNQWDRGLDVVVEGDAVRVTDAAVLSRLTAAWATKWDGRWRLAVRDDASGFRNVDETDFRSEV
jgi:Pyridoxamine 5'-phosphate oxidase